MVCVAAVALGSSTYAWFVSNNTVTATTTTISAQSNAPFLKIDKEQLTDTSTTVATRADETSVALYPAEVVKNTDDNKPKFVSAYASAKGVATELANSRFDVGNTEAALTGKYAIKQSFVIGTTDDKAGSFKNLKVSKVELTDNTTTRIAVHVYIWMEGTDADCVNGKSVEDDPSTSDVTVKLAGVASGN